MLAGRLTRIAAAGLVVAAAACSPSSGPPPAATSTPAGAPPQASKSDGFIVAPDLPPLNAAAVAGGSRSVETVRAVYEFAARHPEVLSYVPCFCGCESAGHKHNADCFVAGRTSDGTVTSWDYHGVG
jgi:hypothetical protein